MFALLRRAHLLIGLLGLAAFLGIGLYMDRVHGHLRGFPDDQRLLFRSTHIYLLLASVTNTVLGLYLRPASGAWRQSLQGLGSLALWSAPLLFLAGFCTEPWLTGLERPWSRPAIYLSLAGAVLHLLSAARINRTGTAA